MGFLPHGKVICKALHGVASNRGVVFPSQIIRCRSVRRYIFWESYGAVRCGAVFTLFSHTYGLVRHGFFSLWCDAMRFRFVKDQSVRFGAGILFSRIIRCGTVTRRTVAPHGEVEGAALNSVVLHTMYTVATPSPKPTVRGIPAFAS